MSLLYAAAAFLVGAGASLAFALHWLRRGARRRRAVLEELLQLRDPMERDTLGALAGAREWVMHAGLSGLSWEGEWYGAPVAGSVGAPPGPAAWLERTIAREDIRLVLRAGLAGSHGEARLFAEQAAQWLFLVLDGALAARELALTASMAQRARLAVFVQHDMRNLAQWIELAAEELAQAEGDAALLSGAARLKLGAAAARERALRIVSTMRAAGDSALPRLEPIDLAAELAVAASLHQVALEVTGELPARLEWDRDALAVVLDNVLGNVSRVSRERMVAPSCMVRCAAGPLGWELSFSTPQLKLDVPLARLFEPWTGASGGGWGIGLYQARRVALAAGADLQPQAAGEGLRLNLLLNCKNS